MDEDVEAFVRRCNHLKHILKTVVEPLEPSGRVWASVMCCCMVELCKSQDDPAGALREIMLVLYNTFHAEEVEDE